MTFYERSDEAGVWFLRNELGHIVSPTFPLYEQLLDFTVERLAETPDPLADIEEVLGEAETVVSAEDFNDPDA